MTVTRAFDLSFADAPAAVLPTGLQRPGLRRRFEAAVADLMAVAEPQACYERFRVEAILHDRLVLGSGRRLGCAALVSAVAGAEELCLAACTLGSALDDRIREHRAEGRALEMLLLDELGSWAIDQMRAQLYEHVGAELAEQGWRVSSPLSPGEATWPLREQRILFRLLEPSRIGVSLAAGDLMRPLKSLTLAFGTGPHEMGSEGLTSCEVCSIRDRCRHAATRRPIPAPA